MALTYLNSVMIEIPAHIDRLSTTLLSAGNLQVDTESVNKLSSTELFVNDINFPVNGGNIFNNARLYGNLTVTGSVTALSGLQVIPTTYATTTALSVVNTGVGPALYVNQQTPGVQSVAVFEGTNVAVLRVNNTEPDEYQPGVDIQFPNNGPALRVGNGVSSSVFVVASGNRVGINTLLPVSELQVVGKTTSTTLNTNSLSSDSVIASSISSNNIAVTNFTTNNTISKNSLVENSFNSYLSSENTYSKFLTADQIQVNSLQALTAVINVFDITQVELSGFQATGDLNVTETVNAKRVVATQNITAPEFIGNVDGDLTGSAFGYFQGTALADGSFVGNFQIDSGVSTVPPTSGSSGNPGQITYDSNYFYVCIAADTWKRVALSAWN